MKKILIIAYNYPPINNGGVQRILNFKKYLPEFGYDTYVLTTDSYGKIEGERNVFRIPDRGFELSHKSFFIIKYPFKVIRKLSVKVGIVGDWFFWWRKEVEKNVDKIIKDNRFDYIIASYPPISDLELGEYISKRYSIPLIIDYRDGLMYDPFDYIRNSRMQTERATKLESRLAKMAKLQIVVNKGMLNYYKNRYIAKTIMVPNGFDDYEQFNELPIQLPDGFNILYTGALGLSRNNYNISVITEIIKQNNDVNFVFIGDYAKTEISEFRKLKNVYIIPKTERKKIIPTQQSADMLLLVSGEDKGGTSGKLYEYIFANTPILNLGTKNEAARLIDEAECGKTYSPYEKDEIREYIENVKDGKLSFKFNRLKKLSRKEQCKYLAEYMNRIGEQ